MKRFNVTTKKPYMKNGEQKVQWNSVGQLVHFPATQEKAEGFILELNMFPGTTFYVFEQKPRDSGQTRQPESTDKEYPEEASQNPSDLPF